MEKEGGERAKRRFDVQYQRNVWPDDQVEIIAETDRRVFRKLRFAA